MNIQHLERPGGRLAYTRQGPAAGDLVVCAPGMGDLGSVYRPLAAALVDAGFRVAVLDLRGHGASDTTFASYDDEALAGDLIALLEALGPGDVVGNSLAAGAAAIAAAQRPELVRRLVLLGPFLRNPKVNPLLMLAMRVGLMRPVGPAVWKAYLKTAYPSRFTSAPVQEHLDEMFASLRRPGRWAAFHRTATRTSHAPAEAALPDVRAKALVVMGSKDPDWPDAAAEAAWASETLGAQLLMVDGAGHYPQLEFPEVVSPAVVAFLSDADA